MHDKMIAPEAREPRTPIDAYLVPQKLTERLIWRDRLFERAGNWHTSCRIETASGRTRLEERAVEDICWLPQARMDLTLPAFTPPQRSFGRWQRFERLPLELDLSEFRLDQRASTIAASLLAIEDLGSNPLVATSWQGWTLWIPALTLLSAVGCPNEKVLSMLLSPGSFGMLLDALATTEEKLVLCRTYGFPLMFYKPRVYECMGFWLEDSARRHALRKTYASVAAGEPLVLPHVEKRLNFTATGYANGSDLVVQVLGNDPREVVWPRQWKQIVIRDLDGHDRVRCKSNSASSPLSGVIEKFDTPLRPSSSRGPRKRQAIGI